MPPSLDTRFSPKRVSLVLFVAWVGSIVATLLIGNFWIALTSVFLGGALPFALLAIWLPRSRFGQYVKAAASLWQLRIFGISVLFAYSVYANKWAGDVINELFGVDPSHFGVSTTVLAVLFAPFGLLYRQDVVGWLWIVFILLGVLLTYILPFSLLVLGRPALGWRAWIGGFIFIFVGAFVLAMSANIAKSFHPLAMRFAIWADFNENHLCTDDWVSKPNSVVFLGDQRVLVYFPQNSVGNHFSVQPCNYARSF
jgi:hypothetical protein